MQWQAGSRQQSAPSGFEPDKSSWGWNWLERWMAVRPWENRFLDINLKDGVMIRDNESPEGMLETSKMKSKPALQDLVEEASSRPGGISSRSRSNPKERSTQSDKFTKKRLSLPNSVPDMDNNPYFGISFFLMNIIAARSNR
ncbi:protein IQ-DOMAIN 1-like [Carica papaya]|uniref:protein IQ-DOMAIN 1-like n=1 Tax=Carica papaya TaxID=3649 RepID=UPI000B8CAA0F|nr:protein IQ-DOMAIN 1-like [Carica papaya]